MKKTTKQMTLDGEVCEYLDSKGNASGYVNDLIKKDMAVTADLGDVLKSLVIERWTCFFCGSFNKNAKGSEKQCWRCRQVNDDTEAIPTTTRKEAPSTPPEEKIITPQPKSAGEVVL